MNKTLTLKLSLVMAALLAWPVAQAANLSKADYKVGKTRISADYKTDKTACAALTGNTKDICVEEAKAKEKVARAELEFSYSGKASDQRKVTVVKADTAYSVAKERCDDKAGNDKDVCVKEAKALKVKALADVKMAEKIGDAKKDATEDKTTANYKVAAEKCEALSGDAKASCLASAKAQFGKN